MSDAAPNPSPTEQHSDPSPRWPSLLQQYRVHMIATAAVVLVAVFFMGGIALGMAKRNFEKKFYLEQIEKLKSALSSAVERQDELGEEIKSLKIDLRAKKDHIAELEDKVAAAERHAEKAEPISAATHAAPHGQAGAAPESSGDAGLDYVRLKAGDCVVDGSSNATAAKWRECLQKSKK